MRLRAREAKDAFVYPVLDSDAHIVIPSSGIRARSSGGPFLELLERAMERHRERPAMRIRREDGSWRELSYADLRADARRVSSWLIERGVARADRIAIVGDSSPDWAIALLGAFGAGAAVVPLDPKLTTTEIVGLLRHAKPRVILASRAHLVKMRLAAERAGSTADVGLLDAVDVGCISVPRMRPQRLRGPRHRANDETALVVYTSGTTGSPKGVKTTFGNLLFETRAMDRRIGPLGEERFLSVLPLNHLYELICGLFTPLRRGACITYADSLLPDEVTKLLRDEQITSLVGVPLLFRALKRGIEQAVRARGPKARKRFGRAVKLSRFAPGAAAKRVLFSPVLSAFAPSLRACYSGGAALEQSVARFFASMGVPIYQGYGLTETSPVIATNSPRANRVGSVGRPLRGVDVRIARKSPDDASGEIQTRGPHVMAGYLDAPEATREVLDDDGWLSTGDLGYLDQDSYLFVTGRSKDLVVLGGGKKVHPDEVEESLIQSPLFQEVCALGLPARSAAARGFDEVCAVVVPSAELRARHEGDAETLRAAVEEEVARACERLATFKRPTRVELRFEALPRTATRKLRRPAVAALLREAS